MESEDNLRNVAHEFATGRIPLDHFLQQISQATVQPAPDANLDVDRQRRCGYPEVIYGTGKSPQTLPTLVQALIDRAQPVLVTRVSEEQATELRKAFPVGKFNAVGRTFRLDENADGSVKSVKMRGQVVLVSAGTSDLPVLEEARETLEWMGVATRVIQDVGVAGPHRLPRHVPEIRQADAVVVVAGMEGALPSVVAGHVEVPVVAVPTSVGYGASLGGVAALLSMLNSCATNVVVVNIDAGFKAGYVAGMIARQRHPSQAKE